MSITTLTDANFDTVISSHDIVFVDFWAQWCKPCKDFAPTFEKVAEKNPDICFAKVDIEAETKLSEDFQVRSVPLLMAFKENIAIFSQPGVMPQSALEDLIQQARDVDMTEVKEEIAKQKD